MLKKFDLMSKKILIIAPNWLGDFIISHSLVRIIKKYYSNAHIVIALPSYCSELVKLMPEVENFIILPFKHKELKILDRYKFAKSLSKWNFDLAIILPNSFKSAIIPWLAKIPRRFGWLGELRFGLLTNFIDNKHKKKLGLMIDYYNAIWESTKVTTDVSDYPKLIIKDSSSEKTKKKFKIPNNFIVIAFGAEFGKAKVWPHYNSFIKKVNKQVIILGSIKEIEASKQLLINNSNKNTINLVGKTNLIEAAAIIKLADAIVCNDSGLMHMAAALGTKVIAIFGSTSSQHTPPLTSNKQIIELNGIPCRPCFQKECPLGHHDCMEKITVDLVLNSLK